MLNYSSSNLKSNYEPKNKHHMSPLKWTLWFSQLLQRQLKYEQNPAHNSFLLSVPLVLCNITHSVKSLGDVLHKMGLNLLSAALHVLLWHTEYTWHFKWCFCIVWHCQDEISSRSEGSTTNLTQTCCLCLWMCQIAVLFFFTHPNHVL